MEHHWENSYWVALFLCAVGAIYIYTYRQVHIPSAIAVDNKTDSTGACVPPYEYVYHAEPNTPNNWTRCMGSAFCVRHGPDYATNRYKASSSDSIYDVFAVSATNSKQKLPHIGRIAALPVDADALQLGAFGVPPYVILHVMVPRYVPSGMFGKKRKDGISSHLTVYGRLSESVRAMIREGRPSPAVSLLRKFVHPVEGARLRKERLKLIVGVVDMHEPGFDPITRAIIKAYNNKPFLSKTASTFYETDDYFEIDVDLHAWGNVSLNILYACKAFLPKMVLRFGVLVEGCSNTELPEQMLVSACLSKFDSARVCAVDKAVVASLVDRVH